MKSSFQDCSGREWKLRLTVGVVSVIKRETGVDLGSIIRSDSAWAELLFSDAEKLVSLLWVLCEGQANAAGITPEDFANLFDGPTLEAAGEALAGSLSDFYPRRKVATALGESLSKILSAVDSKMVADLTAKTSTFCGSAMSLPESSVLTQDE